MGWSSGSGLFSRIAEEIYKSVDDYETRKSVYGVMAEAFQDEDCDTLDECADIDPALDEVLREMEVIGPDEDEQE